jgi:hypothetical protein
MRKDDKPISTTTVYKTSLSQAYNKHAKAQIKQSPFFPKHIPIAKHNSNRPTHTPHPPAPNKSTTCHDHSINKQSTSQHNLLHHN